jgi:hypothetical protein
LSFEWKGKGQGQLVTLLEKEEVMMENKKRGLTQHLIVVTKESNKK